MWQAPGLNGSALGPLCKIMTIGLVLCGIPNSGSSCISDSFAFWVALSSPNVRAFACLVIPCFALFGCRLLEGYSSPKRKWKVDMKEKGGGR